MKRRIHSRFRAGFVLVMVLVVLTLASVLLTGIARRSLSRAVEAMTAQEDLQRRWGLISCQRAILGQATQILEPPPVQGRRIVPPKPREDLELTLGGLTFEIRLADEEAKVNLNRVFAHGGQNEVRRQIQRLAHGNALPVRLRAARTHEPHTPHSKKGTPTKAAGSEATAAPAGARAEEAGVHFSISFGSGGQVFSMEATEDVEDIPTALEETTRSITCWGKGKLNIRTTKDQVLRSALQRVVPAGTISRFLDLRAKNPDLPYKELVALMQLDTAERSPLESWLADESRCHSLWVTIRSSERARQQLYIREVSGDGRSNTSTFVW